MATILVLYYSRYGTTKQLAHLLARGIQSVEGVEAKIRTVPEVVVANPVLSVSAPIVPEQGAPYVSLDDLQSCDGLALGSPVYFGNMAAPMKYFWDQTSSLWAQHALEGKPAVLYTSSSSLHGGQETALMSMMLPLLHHGMLLMGVPYSESALHSTQGGGSPYGAGHVGGLLGDLAITDEEQVLCKALGQRLAKLVKKIIS